MCLCRLSKKINKKVMSMFEKAEQEYQDLKQRKSIIENDKDKIEKVIAELDAKKNETLKKAFLISDLNPLPNSLI